MAGSVIYKSRWLYGRVLRLLYGREFSLRYREVAALIPNASRVIDVCAGDARLYLDYLKGRTDYLGLDLSRSFIEQNQKIGVAMEHFDVLTEEIPKGDVVVLMGSLYQFIPNESTILKKMLASAKKRIIISEPIRNLSDSKFPPLRWLSAMMTDPGDGAKSKRFNESSLRKAFESLNLPAQNLYYKNLGREFLVWVDIES